MNLCYQVTQYCSLWEQTLNQTTKINCFLVWPKYYMNIQFNNPITIRITIGRLISNELKEKLSRCYREKNICLVLVYCISHAGGIQFFFNRTALTYDSSKKDCYAFSHIKINWLIDIVGINIKLQLIIGMSRPNNHQISTKFQRVCPLQD